MNQKQPESETVEQLDTQALFSRLAWIYDFEKYLLFSLRKKAVQFANLNSKQIILDVATGTGSLAQAFAKAGHTVVGIDFAWGMLKQAQKKSNLSSKLSLLQANATRMSFKNSTFDLASISLALHDMPEPIEKQVLREMKRVIKSGSKIIIVDYQEPRNHWLAKMFFPIINLYETPYFKQFITRGLEKIISESELKIVRRMNFLNLVQILEVKA